MNLHRPTDAERASLAAFTAALQTRAEHHVGFLGTDADGIADEIVEDVDDWTEAAMVAVDEGRTVGWLMGSIDHDMGRVWWFGPFVDRDDAQAWRDVADRLADATGAVLDDRVTEEEFAFDAHHRVGAAWAVARGFTAEPGSAVLTLDRLLEPPSVPIRVVGPADAGTVGRLHDELFANTHTAGAALVGTTDPHRLRLAVELGGELAGYVAVERQPDGSGYIDFLGVHPAHRRRGLGAELVRAGVTALAGLGCDRFHLTVREANLGARALYDGLGFTEERVIRPFRRGFTLP